MWDGDTWQRGGWAGHFRSSGRGCRALSRRGRPRLPDRLVQACVGDQVRPEPMPEGSGISPVALLDHGREGGGGGMRRCRSAGSPAVQLSPSCPAPFTLSPRSGYNRYKAGLIQVCGCKSRPAAGEATHVRRRKIVTPPSMVRLSRKSCPLRKAYLATLPDPLIRRPRGPAPAGRPQAPATHRRGMPADFPPGFPPTCLVSSSPDRRQRRGVVVSRVQANPPAGGCGGKDQVSWMGSGSSLWGRVAR